MEKRKRYFPVVYLRNGDACIGSPLDTENDCRKALADAVTKNPEKISATTYMVREDEDVMSILGHPKSRDLIMDRAFMKGVKKL